MSSPKLHPQPNPRPAVSPAIYARVSTIDQDCAIQLAGLRADLARRQWPAATEYVEYLSGKASQRRPRFDALMTAALAGQHDVILVYKLDRFGRSLLHLKQSLEKLNQSGIRFISVTENIDTGAANGSAAGLHMNILGSFAEFERERILERTTEGRLKKFAEGKPDSWMLRYGYRVVNDASVVVPAEAEHVLRMFHERAEHKSSIYELAGLMGQWRAKPRRGNHWHPTTIREMLTSRQYIGEYLRCGRIFTIPPIVPLELFDRVQADFAAKEVYKRKCGQPDKSDKYLLRGFLFCTCTRRMHGMRHTGPYGYSFYRCEGKVRKSQHETFEGCKMSPYMRTTTLEDLVWAEVWRLLKDPRRLHNLAQAFAQRENAAKPQAHNVRQELDSARAEESRVLRMVQRGLYDEDKGLIEVTKLRSKIQSLEAQVRMLGKIVEIAPLSRVEQLCRMIAEGPEPAGYAPRRMILEKLRDFTVTLSRQEVVISGKVPMDLSAATDTPGGKKYCRDGFTGVVNSFNPIPFILKVAA